MFKLLIDYNYFIITFLLVISSIFVNLFYIRIFFYIINRIHFNNMKINKENYIKYLLITLLSFLNFFFILIQEPLLGSLFCLYL